ncbi:MAG: hypothetical protein OEW75_18750 [Cyclobacteriaceae bacterium]|nr:hypothetical protein [Cyclobacteriaceae bacterium]
MIKRNTLFKILPVFIILIIGTQQLLATPLDCYTSLDTLKYDSTIYYNSGNVLAYMEFDSGGLLVSYKSFYKNGNNRIVANFKNGLIDGEFKTFLKNGSIYSIMYFKNGKILSGMTVYRKNGTKKYLYLTRDTKRDRFYSRLKYDRHGNETDYKEIEEYPVSYYLWKEAHRSGSIEGNSERVKVIIQEF